ncbi:hypothetical protein [Brachyspira sp.]|uniref:hypothetical protein n=1 Tax=Brachyspira sp. TaxID=1977261 RepID=UPI0026289813|nr:hypothetical protein [Brachyspira sp.]
MKKLFTLYILCVLFFLSIISCSNKIISGNDYNHAGDNNVIEKINSKIYVSSKWNDEPEFYMWVSIKNGKAAIAPMHMNNTDNPLEFDGDLYYLNLIRIDNNKFKVKNENTDKGEEATLEFNADYSSVTVHYNYYKHDYHGLTKKHIRCVVK